MITAQERGLWQTRLRAAKDWEVAIADALCLVQTYPGLTCKIQNCLQKSQLRTFLLGSVPNRETYGEKTRSLQGFGGCALAVPHSAATAFRCLLVPVWQREGSHRHLPTWRGTPWGSPVSSDWVPGVCRVKLLYLHSSEPLHTWAFWDQEHLWVCWSPNPQLTSKVLQSYY